MYPHCGPDYPVCPGLTRTRPLRQLPGYELTFPTSYCFQFRLVRDLADDCLWRWSLTYCEKHYPRVVPIIISAWHLKELLRYLFNVLFHIGRIRSPTTDQIIDGYCRFIQDPTVCCKSVILEFERLKVSLLVFPNFPSKFPSYFYLLICHCHLPLYYSSHMEDRLDSLTQTASAENTTLIHVPCHIFTAK